MDRSWWSLGAGVWRLGRLGGESGLVVLGAQCLGCGGLGGWEARVAWRWWGLSACGMAAWEVEGGESGLAVVGSQCLGCGGYLSG